jgi:molybdate transport system permease protein
MTLRAGIALLSAILLLLICVPIAALFVHTTPATLGAALGSPFVAAALRLSLVTTAISAALIVALGTPLAYALARGDFPGRAFADAAVDLPIVLPPSVAGLALLLAFGRHGTVGAWLDRAGITLAFTTAAVVMAQVFVAAPFYVRAARSGFAAVDRTLEEASATLGYSPLGTFRRVTVPLALPALIGGLTLAWARALGELGATLMFAGNLAGVSQTMPLAVYLGLESGRIEEATALALILVAVSIAALATLRRAGTI